MSIELTMPALSPTMEKGVLAKWLVKAGDVVKAGDFIAEIETDKATMEVEAPQDGAIGAIVVPEGTEDVLVGAVIALYAAPGERPAATIAQAPRWPATVADIPAVPPSPAPPAASVGSMKASPLARRIARIEGLDLSAIVGTGPHGRIVKADLGLHVLRPKTTSESAATHLNPAATKPPAGVPFTAVKLSGMRKTIAKRLAQAKQIAPHFYLGVDVRLDDLLAARETLNASLAERGAKLSVNDFLIKALAIALEQVPEANVQFASDELYRFDRIDISMAVAVPGGLVTPVIVDAANKRLSRIAAETKEFAARARAGKLAPEEYEGGTASISNLGMFGMKTITPVLNAPQAVILGVGAAEERPIVVDGAVVVATMVSVNASFDHRALDGAVGAALLRAFKTIVEHPIDMLA